MLKQESLTLIESGLIEMVDEGEIMKSDVKRIMTAIKTFNFSKLSGGDALIILDSQGYPFQELVDDGDMTEEVASEVSMIYQIGNLIFSKHIQAQKGA